MPYKNVGDVTSAKARPYFFFIFGFGFGFGGGRCYLAVDVGASMVAPTFLQKVNVGEMKSSLPPVAALCAGSSQQ